VVWSSYGSFLGFALVLTLVPGPDFAVVVKNTLASGSWRGAWSAVGVTCSNVVQGVAAAAGLGAVILRVEPAFEAVKWAGVGYLVYLGIQSLRAAVRGEYAPLEGGGARRAGATAWGGWRQGFLSNITNPKVLVFYLAVLPQFLGPAAPVWTLLVFASTHAVVGLFYLLALVAVLDRAQGWLSRRRVRRSLDAATGVVLLAFSARLATD
jgi:threonine/homoserine/homoserine lactone efflux protein